jgi:hypothetical protein
MRKVCLLIAMVAVIGCGSNDQENGGRPRACPPADLQLSSVSRWCNDQAIAAFGPGYATGDYSGGLCPNFMALSCNNFSMDWCALQDGADCVAAYHAYDKCVHGLSCPSGDWTIDFGYSACGGSNVATTVMIGEASPGVYVVMMETGPFPSTKPNASPGDCAYRFYDLLSASFIDGKFVSTLQREGDSASSPQEAITVVMTIRSDCLAADVNSTAQGCEACDDQGNCSGLGSLTCDAPKRVAVRSEY